MTRAGLNRPERREAVAPARLWSQATSVLLIIDARLTPAGGREAEIIGPSDP